MRVLGLDVGQRRIGLAIGDAEAGLAMPLGAIRRLSRARDVEAVLARAREQQVSHILVGIPYSMDGSLGPWGRAVMSFANALRAADVVPVEPWDERLSTAEAERLLHSVGAAPSRDRGRLDAASAAVILQSYLDGQRGASVQAAVPSGATALVRNVSEGSGPKAHRLGIIGYPLRHTLSPVIQQAALDYCGVDARYEAWETPPEQLAETVRRLAAQKVLGFNVTVPHKEAVCPLLDELTDWPRQVGAVNTVVSRRGHLVGYNTDADGFLRALRGEGGFDPQGASVLVLGAGGSARAVTVALGRAGVASLTIANRTLARAEALAEVVRGRIREARVVALTDKALGTVMRSASPPDLIVNCTSMGMAHGLAQDRTPLSADLIPPSAVVYDLVYTPPLTPLLREAEKAGARTLGGLPMLVYQGSAAFELWTGQQAPVDVMFKAARAALGQS